MAEDDDQSGDTQDNADKAGGGGKKKIILLAVLMLVIIGISVGGTLAVLSLMGAKETPAEESEEVVVEEEPRKPAIYYPIKPSVLVTFNARGRQRYLQADLTLMMRDDDVIAAVELHMPTIRNALNLIIGGQTYEDVQTVEGKELMRLQCLQELQRILEQEIGKPGIEQVLFTNLVMQ